MSTNNTCRRKAKKLDLLRAKYGYPTREGGPMTIEKAISLGKLPPDFHEYLRKGLEDGTLQIMGAASPAASSTVSGESQ